MFYKSLLVFAMLLAGLQSAAAQTVGAKAGSSYVPTTHSSACGGLLCDGVDPARLPDGTAAPPPPCKAIICGDTPVTASDMKRAEEERARTAAAAPAPEPVATPKSRRKKVVRAKKAPVVATRTPAPPAAPAAR